MTIAEEFKSRNFSIYGQWMGIICILVCFATGLSAIISFKHIYILFGILALVSSFLIVFVELPLLLRICPTSSKFDAFIRNFATNYMRAAIYFIMSIIQWLSLVPKEATSLIGAAVVLLLAAICYTVAGFQGKGFVGSKTLGGQGVAQMIV